MAFLDMDFSDVVEPRVAAADTEYKLRITDVKDERCSTSLTAAKRCCR